MLFLFCVETSGDRFLSLFLYSEHSVEIYFTHRSLYKNELCPPDVFPNSRIAYLNTGVAGQNIFIIIRCPASASPFESLFGRAPRRAQGKGRAVRCGSEHSVANPSQYLRWGRLSFGEREVLTFPPLCPLPLSKGGAFYLCPASAAPFESLFGWGPAASARERARGTTRQRSIAWPIPLN